MWWWTCYTGTGIPKCNDEPVNCRDCLAFATEPVLRSLANELEQDSDESPAKLDEVEIKYGFIQVNISQ